MAACIVPPSYLTAVRWCFCLCAAVTIWLPASYIYADNDSLKVNIGSGPLNTPSLSAGNFFRSTGYIASPSRVPEGSWGLLTSLSWVNTWNVEQDNFMIDGEWLHLAARLSYMLKTDVELGVNIPFLGRTGGFADGFIEEFHNIFDLGNACREDYSRNQNIVDIRGPDDRHVHLEGEQWGLSDMSLFASWTVTKGGRFLPCVVVGGEAILPTGDEDKLLGSGKPVFDVSTLLSKRINTTPCLLFLGTSVSYSDNNKMAGIDTRKTQFVVLSGLEYEWNNRLSIILQNLITSPIVEKYYEFSKPTNELNIGLRIRDDFQGEWEISFQENLFYFNNSADVGVHVAYRRVL